VSGVVVQAAAMTAPVFTENWFDEPSCHALAELARSTEYLRGDIVEVGSWEGRSTIALANAVYPHTVHAVDTWQGSPGEISADLAAERDVLAQFHTNVAAMTKGNVEPFVGDWRDYFAEHRQPIKFMFVDACHTYDEVKDNIEAALPLLVSGGVLCGDDVHHPPVRFAVLYLLPDARSVATLWFWRKP
jgi:predicted O-methyltransferase YrrM